MQRKIPTLLGIFLTLVLVAGLVFATSQMSKVTKLFSRAQGNLAPIFLETGNITDSGFTIFWTTETETTGAVFFGKKTTLGDGIALDDRDSGSPNGKFLTHFVRINGLLPQTKYYFKVGSGTATFGDQTKTDSPFVLTTGEKSSNTSIVDPVFGKILDSTGAPVSGVIAIFEASGAGRIVSLSKSDGTYVLPVVNTTTLAETITLEGGTARSVISCQSGLDRPVPTVKLGENADCSKPSPAPPKASSGGEITTNISDGETVSSPLPTVSGRAGPNQVVKIEIHSPTVYSGTVKADPAGNWSWTPPANLSPGQHTVTITVVNADGTTQTVTRTFYVSSGENILPITSGTPSAILTHLTCLSYRCVTISGAGPNDCTMDADCGATPSATPPPSIPPVLPPVIPPPPPPPTTGRTENTLILLTLGLIFATLGVGLVWKNE